MHVGPPVGRRRFVTTVALGLSAWTVPGLFAEQLTRTPAQTEGPFYPDRLPLDTDNDLLVVNGAITPAVGEVTHLSGRVLSPTGSPVRNAVVEIWQCDHDGVYIHTQDAGRKPRDRNFQGYGRFLTDSSGAYYFRTIRPVAYPGRTPHIHFKVTKGGHHLLTTQCYVKGDPGNARDGIWQSVKDPRARDAVTVAFAPIPGSKTGELAATFDVVLGLTPSA
jgi:protocatechuate 3,4-dioxygenase beta subunit